MIDTVCLTIPLSSIVLLDENDKQVPQWDLQSKTEHYSKYVRNPSKVDKDTGLYFPRLTFYRRPYGHQGIKIEFSVPKLIFNNNLEELSNSDFDEVINQLQDRLKRMGVRIFKEVLVSAPVTTVHFSKNIELTEGYTSTHVISELGKIDLRKSFDFARARYINNGQSLCAHTRAHELVIYDKIADSAKTKKRAIDKDQTVSQRSLFKSMQASEKPSEVLRIEARLCNKRKINSVFKKLDLLENPTFKDIFCQDIGMSVVGHYWESIIKGNQLALFTLNQSAKDLLKEMCLGDPSIKPKQAIYQVGLMTLAKDGEGLRELRSIFEAHTSDRNWYRIKSDFKDISQNISNKNVRTWVKEIEKQIENYKPLKPNV